MASVFRTLSEGWDADNRTCAMHTNGIHNDDIQRFSDNTRLVSRKSIDASASLTSRRCTAPRSVLYIRRVRVFREIRNWITVPVGDDALDDVIE
jgi:hypothetical protein